MEAKKAYQRLSSFFVDVHAGGLGTWVFIEK
jgi:hypothetical protein